MRRGHLNHPVVNKILKNSSLYLSYRFGPKIRAIRAAEGALRIGVLRGLFRVSAFLEGPPPMNRITPERSLHQPLHPEEEIVDIGAWLRMIWRGKGLIALSAILLTALAASHSAFLATPSYKARAVVMLESREEKVVDLKDVISGLSGDANVINSEVEVIRGRELMREVTARLALHEDPEFNALLRPETELGAMLSRAKSSSRRTLGLPEKALSTPTAAQVEDSTIDALLDNLTVHNVPNSLVFRIIARSESPEKAALIANTVVDVYIERQLAVKSKATEQASTWLHGRVADLKNDLARTETQVIDYRATADLIEPRELAVLEDRIRNLRAEIAPLSGTPEEAISSVKEPARGTVIAAAQIPSSPAAVAELRRLQSQLEANARKLSTLEQMEREASASSFLYETFLARMKETAAQLGIQRADSRLLSRASVPANPASPNIPRILAVAAVLGAMLGAAFHMLREAGQTAFRTVRELEFFTNHRVMGQIPALRTRKLTAIRSYLARRPNSAMAEALRNLRTSLFLNGPGTPPQVVVLSSALPGDGKTTLSLALAQNIAQMGKKVLLIEGDIRRGQVSRHFGKRAARGLLAVLSGKARLEDVVFHSRAIGADVLFGERSAVNSSDLFSGPHFDEMLKEARSLYDVIILDTPPVLIVPDARIIAQAADATLFLVKWNTTTQHQVEEALHMFETVHVPITGLVLNQISLSGMRRYGVAGGLGTYRALGRKYYQV